MTVCSHQSRTQCAPLHQPSRSASMHSTDRRANSHISLHSHARSAVERGRKKPSTHLYLLPHACLPAYARLLSPQRASEGAHKNRYATCTCSTDPSIKDQVTCGKVGCRQPVARATFWFTFIRTSQWLKGEPTESLRKSTQLQPCVASTLFAQDIVHIQTRGSVKTEKVVDIDKRYGKDVCGAGPRCRHTRPGTDRTSSCGSAGILEPRFEQVRGRLCIRLPRHPIRPASAGCSAFQATPRSSAFLETGQCARCAWCCTPKSMEGRSYAGGRIGHF